MSNTVPTTATPVKLESKADTIVFTTSKQQEASDIRCKILQNFRRMWVYVYNNSGEYSVAVANEFCGKLSESKLNEIRVMINKSTKATSENSSEILPTEPAIQEILKMLNAD